MDDFKFYEVGGKIRDELLGLTNKDVAEIELEAINHCGWLM